MQVKIGKIVNTHGIKGEIRILSNSDFFEKRFSEGCKITAVKRGVTTIFTIKSSYKHKQFIIVRLENFDNINDVEQFKNALVYGEKMTQDQLDEDEYLDSDLVGMMLIDDVTNKIFSNVVEVIQNPAHNLLRLKYNEKLYLIPFKKEFISKIDLDNKIIYFTNMKGLIDED